MTEGIIRGKTYRTTYSDKAAPFPFDNVNRNFKARWTWQTLPLIWRPGRPLKYGMFTKEVEQLRRLRLANNT